VRPRIDITSAMHRDALETVDEPLVIQNYLGIEGLFKTGLEVSNYLPLPWENVTHEAIFGMMEGGTGEDGTMFGTSLRRQTYFGRLKNFWEISDHSSAQLGTTYMLGSSNDEAVADVHAVVTDFVYTHKFNSEEKLTLKSEAIFQNRSQGVEQSEESDTYGFRHSPWGMYSLAEYRFAPRWAFGGRWDYVQPIDLGTDGSRAATIGWNTFLTFYQSEFARWRFQYEHVNNAEESSNNIFFLQGTFAIGTHKHALQ
ncbi:MAG: hypothetical protein J0M12_18065, partial [Deltaproteobacteria bacterium]|nr:hypothetical protein [Deltaproteobacteria bacterium]